MSQITFIYSVFHVSLTLTKNFMPNIIPCGKVLMNLIRRLSWFICDALQTFLL